jgi:TolB-like protein/Tfp pilus assembly protein PilF
MADDAIRFGPFLFDPGRMTLARDGTVTQLGNRGALLLKTLADAAGGTVGKEALMNAAWPGVAVEESNLTVQIAGLRKMLGQNAEGQDWIVTVPREGYRLLAPVSVDAQVPTQGAEPPVVAVLPFRNLSPDAETDYFGDGVVSDIISALSRFRAFSVVSRNTVFARRAHDADIRQAAVDFRATYLVEGDIRRAGDRLRISVRLVRGSDSLTLWADRFEGMLSDVFEFQDRITEEVASRLGPAIEIAEITRSQRDRARSFAAYDVYLRALAWLDEETADGNRRAHDLLVRALEIEPDNPGVLGHAAWALEHRTAMGWPPIGPDDKERCLDFARRGLLHGAGNARVMAHCGMALLQTGKDYAGGMRVIRAAAAANPNDLFVACNLTVATMHCGDLDEALAHAHRALRLGPYDPDARFPMTSIAMIAIMRADYEEALVWAARSLSVNASFDATYWMLISANAHLGRMDDAHAHLARLMALAPGVTLARIEAGQPVMHPERIAAIISGLKLAGLQ